MVDPRARGPRRRRGARRRRAERRRRPGDTHGHHAYQQRNLVSDLAGPRASPTATSSTRGGCRSGRARRRGSPTTAPTSRRCTPARERPDAATIVPLVVNDPGRRADRDRVQPRRAGSSCISDGQRAGALPVLLGGRADHRLEPRVPPTDAGPDRRERHGRDLQGARDRQHAQHGPLLYATDFHAQPVDVWDDAFSPAARPGGFTDPRAARRASRRSASRRRRAHRRRRTPSRTPTRRTRSHGAGLGFVDVYDTSGTLLKRLVSRGPAERAVGHRARAERLRRLERRPAGRQLRRRPHQRVRPAQRPLRGRAAQRARATPIEIDGLWALAFGNGTIGTPQTLLFTAGPDDESHGLFGEIVAR